jgi:hypothetical protein
MAIRVEGEKVPLPIFEFSQLFIDEEIRDQI